MYTQQQYPAQGNQGPQQQLPYAQQTTFAPQRVNWKGFASDSQTKNNTRIFWHNLCFHADGRLSGGATTKIDGRPTVYHLTGRFQGDGSVHIQKTINGINTVVNYNGRVVGSNRIQGYYQVNGQYPQAGSFDMVCDASRWEGAVINNQTQIEKPVQLEISVTTDGVFGVNWTSSTGLYLIEGSYNIGNHTMLLNIHFLGLNVIRRVQAQVTLLHGDKKITGNYQDSTQEVGKIHLTKNQKYVLGSLGATPGFGPEQGKSFNLFIDEQSEQNYGQQPQSSGFQQNQTPQYPQQPIQYNQGQTPQYQQNQLPQYHQNQPAQQLHYGAPMPGFPGALEATKQNTNQQAPLTQAAPSHQ